MSQDHGVTTVGIFTELFITRHPSCPLRVQMNIANQRQHVGILFAKDGFVAVLEKVASPAVAQIITHGVPRQNPLHDGGQGAAPVPFQEVKMIRNQRPGISARFALSQNSSQAVKEIILVIIAHEDLITSNSTTHHVV
jgi:hypothetical protein